MLTSMIGAKTEKNQQFTPAVSPVWEEEKPKPILPQGSPLAADGQQNPIPVVKVYSTRGVEYGMMTIVLWVLASTLAWLLINLINGSKTFDYLVVPTSALVVCVPVFGLLFLRLKKAELATPSLKYEPSKRRWSQLTQFVAFIVVLVNLIVFVYEILVRFGTDKKSESLMKSSLTTLVILVIAGGILAYYWFEEHRNK
jgi:hypothetical protein